MTVSQPAIISTLVGLVVGGEHTSREVKPSGIDP
jgi:hypothetical protein